MGSDVVQRGGLNGGIVYSEASIRSGPEGSIGSFGSTGLRMQWTDLGDDL